MELESHTEMKTILLFLMTVNSNTILKINLLLSKSLTNHQNLSQNKSQEGDIIFTKVGMKLFPQASISEMAEPIPLTLMKWIFFKAFILIQKKISLFL